MEKLSRKLALLFKFGSLISLAILGMGLIWFFLKPADSAYLKNGTLKLFFHNLLPHDAISLLNLGVLVLMLLPILGLIFCLRHFASVQDNKFKRIALTVILILGFGIFLGLMQV